MPHKVLLQLSANGVREACELAVGHENERHSNQKEVAVVLVLQVLASLAREAKVGVVIGGLDEEEAVLEMVVDSD